MDRSSGELDIEVGNSLYLQYLGLLRGRYPTNVQGVLRGFIGYVLKNEKEQERTEVVGAHILFSDELGWTLNRLNLNHPEPVSLRQLRSGEDQEGDYTGVNSERKRIVKPSGIGEIIVIPHVFEDLGILIDSIPHIENLCNHQASLEMIKRILDPKYFTRT